MMVDIVANIGINLAHIAMTVDPEIFVIGGRCFQKPGDFLIDKIREKFIYYLLQRIRRI